MPTFSKIASAVLCVFIVGGNSEALETIEWEECGKYMCGDVYFCCSDNKFAYKKSCDGACVPGAGPTIRVTQGQLYNLTIHNQCTGDTSTNFHAHGSHTSGEGNHDNVRRHLGAGFSMVQNYFIQGDHQVGTNWYHPHLHGQVASQVRLGAYGLFIVDGKQQGDYDDNVKKFLTNRDIERRLQVTSAGLANGVMGGAKVKLVKDQWHYVRILHVIPSGTGSAKASFTAAAQAKCDVYELAADGIYYSTFPYHRKYDFEVHAAQRLDLAVKCRDAGTFEYKFNDYTVAKFKVESGEKGEETPFVNGNTWTPLRPGYLTDLMDDHYPSFVKDVTKTVIKLASMTINDRSFSETTPTAIFPYGPEYIQEFTVQNSKSHPWHLHQQHFQVVQPGGCGLHQYGEWYDTIVSDDECKVRTRFVDFSGMIMHHCHDLDHEDQGMMGWFQVDKQPGSFEESDLFVEQQSEFPHSACKHEGDSDSGHTDSGKTPEQHADTKSAEVAGDVIQMQAAPVYPWIIMGVSLFIAVGAVAFAVWTVHRNSNHKESVAFDDFELGPKVVYPDLVGHGAMPGTPVAEPFAP